MTSKFTIARTIGVSSINAVSSTNVTLTIVITSVKLTGAGQVLTFNSMTDLDMGFIATGMSLTSIKNVNMPGASSLTWSFSKSTGLVISGTQVFPAGGGSIKLEYTFNRSWNKGVFYDYRRDTNFLINMSPAATATNCTSQGTSLTITYTPPSPNLNLDVTQTTLNGWPSPVSCVLNGWNNLLLVARNSIGAPLIAGGSDIVFTVDGTDTSYGIQDNQNGEYSVFYIPKFAGNYTVTCTVYGADIRDCPVGPIPT